VEGALAVASGTDHAALRATLIKLETLAPLGISTRVTNLSPAPVNIRERIDQYLQTIGPATPPSQPQTKTPRNP
jgi:hypothetical protein